MTWLLLLAQVIALDIILSGDNAVVIAGAANALPKSLRDQAMIAGIVLALVARFALVSVAGLLVHIKIISVVGGLFLFWVAYKMAKGAGPGETKPLAGVAGMAAAITTIVVADIGMSLDNIVAIAGLTKGHPAAMAVGLIASISILGLGAKIVSGFTERYRWLNLAGAALVAWVGLTLVI